jgi:membrane protease YdiL (CAAX protease family)
MTAPTLLDHAFVLVLVVLFPVRSATFGYRRLREARPERVPEVRVKLYRQALGLQWSLTAITIAVWAHERRPWSALGLVFRPSWVTLGLALASATAVTLMLAQLPGALRDYDALARVRRRLANLERMLPRTDTELALFWLLALTAGVCEETLYRGYLFWYLGHWLPVVAVLIVGAIVFGIGHSYQGRRGVLTTTLAGLVAGGVYLLTGSLYLPMALHAFMDAWSGYVGRAALRAGEGTPVDTTGLAGGPPVEPSPPPA